MAKKFPIKKWSIRTNLVSIILICLIMSVGIMAYYSYFYYTRSISNRLRDAVNSETTSMTAIAADKLNSIIRLSRDITYEGEFEEIVTESEREGYNKNLFKEAISTSLLKKFYSKNEVMFVGFIYANSPGDLYYYETTGNRQLYLFRENVMELALNNMKTDSPEVEFFIYDGYVYIIRNLLSIRDLSKLGCLIIQVEEDYLFGHFKNNTTWSDELVYSINGQEKTFTEKTIYDIRYVEQSMRSVSKEVFTDENHLYVIGAQNTNDYELKCMSIVNQNKVYSSAQDIFSITVFLIVVIIPFIAILLFQVYKSISVPIDKLAGAMKSFEHGNFGIVYEYEKNDEFRYLFDSFNHMTKQIETLMENLYEEELASKDAKIMALQSQINPHFLNNTLEMLLWQARRLGDQEIEGMLEALCVIFNASMDRSSKRFVLLSEEIEYVTAYLYISEKRFKEKLTISESIDDSLGTILIPRLTIQPLMENAIKHGIEPIGSGTIWISIKENGDLATIKIINNGKVLTDEDAQRINNILSGTIKVSGTTSLGIRNLNERIKLLYGEEYGLTIYRDKYDRTVSRLIVPILRNDNIKGT